MPKNAPYLVSLDIGSTKVCALIAEPQPGGRVDVLGKGTAAHKGARRGAIIDVPATIDAIKRATEEAEIMAGAQIERAIVGVSGPSIKSFNSRQVVAVSAKNREITREDIQRSLDAARSVPIPSEFEVLHVLPREFVVDGQEGVADPLGMVGSRLEADVHVVTVPVATVQNLLNCVNRAGIEVIELVLEPLAASEAVLTPDERELGIVLADIGGGTTELAVWCGGTLAATSVLPIGGDHFTNDIAVVKKAPVPDAERLKRKYGSALPALVPEEETIDMPQTGGRGVHPVRRREIAEILNARADELLQLVWDDAAREVPAKDLKAGLVLTGGGADLDGLVEVAEQIVGLPVRRGVPHNVGGLKDIVAAPEWACAVGLLLYASASAAAPARRPKSGPAGFVSKLKNSLKKVFPSSASL
jgi:cell division protein FtsA